MAECETIPEVAARFGTTPGAIRERVRGRFAELNRAGLLTRVGPLYAVPAGRAGDLLARLDAPPPEDERNNRG